MKQIDIPDELYGFVEQLAKSHSVSMTDAASEMLTYVLILGLSEKDADKVLNWAKGFKPEWFQGDRMPTRK